MAPVFQVCSVATLFMLARAASEQTCGAGSGTAPSASEAVSLLQRDVRVSRSAAAAAAMPSAEYLDDLGGDREDPDLGKVMAGLWPNATKGQKDDSKKKERKKESDSDLLSEAAGLGEAIFAAITDIKEMKTDIKQIKSDIEDLKSAGEAIMHVVVDRPTTGTTTTTSVTVAAVTTVAVSAVPTTPPPVASTVPPSVAPTAAPASAAPTAAPAPVVEMLQISQPTLKSKINETQARSEEISSQIDGLRLEIREIEGIKSRGAVSRPRHAGGEQGKGNVKNEELSPSIPAAGNGPHFPARRRGDEADAVDDLAVAFASLGR